MKLEFIVEKNKYTEYCPECWAANVDFTKSSNKIICPVCLSELDRIIIIDPKLKWWLDENNVYWHESVGILIINPANKVLFYELTKFPYGLTIPAGHVDNKESPKKAALREAREETGLNMADLGLCINANIGGDSCRRGSDNHRWSLYVYKLNGDQIANIVIDDREGCNPVWLDLGDILNRLEEMPPAMRYIFNNYKKDIYSHINNL